MRRVAAIILLVLVVFSAWQLVRSGPGIEPEFPPLLVISIDGFRPDYFERAETPALDRLVAGGLKADSLMQVFPTKTFPTHYSMVTGLYAEITGVVANSMWDPERRARFSLGNRDAVSDGYWYDGEPIWNTVEKAGRIAATYFWPGSEARIDGIRPTYFKPYAGDTPHAKRVEQVLDWLDMPDSERPDFLTLYFSVVDSVAHSHGPDDARVDRAIGRVDRAIALLLDGLEQRGLFGAIHVLITSDHGMSAVAPERYIYLDDYLDLSGVRVSDWGPAAQIWARDLSAEEIVAALDGVHPRLRAWTRADIPARYRFREHRRIAGALAEADPGWMISSRPRETGPRTRRPPLGMHGWDPAWLEMHGILIAHGPAFAPGSRMPAARSVDLYTLMTELLGLDPAPNDGALDMFLPYLDNSEPEPVETQHWDCDGAPFGLRRGPAGAGLHHGGYVFALPRAHAPAGERYADTGVEFMREGDSASIEIDGRSWEECRPAGSRPE